MLHYQKLFQRMVEGVLVIKKGREKSLIEIVLDIISKPPKATADRCFGLYVIKKNKEKSSNRISIAAPRVFIMYSLLENKLSDSLSTINPLIQRWYPYLMSKNTKK